MFAVIVALYMMPNGHITWEVYQDGFNTYEECELYVEDHQRELADYSKIVCDTLKEAR